MGDNPYYPFIYFVGLYVCFTFLQELEIGEKEIAFAAGTNALWSFVTA